MTTAKLDANGHRWVAALSNYIFTITYKPGKGHVDADVLSHIRWPEAIDIDTQKVHAVCKRVQAPYGKWKPFARGSKWWIHCVRDNVPPGMTPLQWCQAQAKDPAIHYIVDSIQNKTLRHLKIQGDMPSELKALIRVRRQLLFKEGVLYRRITSVNAKSRLQYNTAPITLY